MKRVTGKTKYIQFLNQWRYILFFLSVCYNLKTYQLISSFLKQYFIYCHLVVNNQHICINFKHEYKMYNQIKVYFNDRSVRIAITGFFTSGGMLTSTAYENMSAFDVYRQAIEKSKPLQKVDK